VADDHRPRRVTERRLKPLEQVTKEGRARLGRLLEIRRGHLGHLDRKAFAADRESRGIKLDWRTYTDVENAYRDNLTAATLASLARAYEVTYDSMLAVARGDADELEPAEPARAAAQLTPRQPPDGWLTPAEVSNARRFADPIFQRLLDLIHAGVRDPDGAQLFPADPAGVDAQAWDLYSKSLSELERVWLIADAKARQAAHGRQSETG
jgi:hypothetical protein